MMCMGKLKPGKTLDDLEKALSEGPPGGGGAEGGGEEPSHGQGGQTTTTTTGATTTSAAQSQQGGQSEEGGGGGQEGEEESPTAEVVDEIGLPGNFMSPGQSAEVTVPDLRPGSTHWSASSRAKGTAPHTSPRAWSTS